MRAVGVIPARFHSSRFPGKPLALIGGKPLVEHVYERARGARLLARLLVATEDERIVRLVQGFGGEALMTSPDHPSGTDRLAEVARRVPADLFVNIQGDEPLLEPSDVDRLVECLAGDPAIDMATLAEPIRDEEAFRDPNVVKIVCDGAGRALYFSRAPIPCSRFAGVANHPPGAAAAAWRRHVGIYAYRARFLSEFASWSPGTLERIEGLEQLRALERGRSIRVLDARGRYLGVDTPADVVAVEKALLASS
ncbi:MAG TPA: 3-deoxy-manno-octulosonate cytidylyltransferase [Candidatus Polarisedimenticolia bacterium]|nr:3-deoxy-manno-octulosonate cytidylyltransferase [Candidatus Polarisedimenticolia bacterium]